MKQISSLLLALVMCLSLLAACGKTDAPAPIATPTPEVTATPEATPEFAVDVEPELPAFLTFTDDAGRTVELPTELTRISPSGPLAQMYLLAIAPELLATSASNYSVEDANYIPDSVLGLPVVGAFYGSDDLNYESIAAIGTEIVIDIGEPKKTIVEDMDTITTNLAIPAVHITATLNSSPDAFRTLGKILGREERGEELAVFCERILTKTNTMIAGVGTGKASALCLVGESGLNVLAATSFHSEVIDLMTDNLAVLESPSSKGSGNETDFEQISVWNPEVIIFAPDSAYATVADDPTWNTLDAIASGSYYEIPSGPYNWMANPPSINRYLGMIWLGYILYTGDYADFSADVTEYYRLFYSYDLTPAEISTFLGE